MYCLLVKKHKKIISKLILAWFSLQWKAHLLAFGVIKLAYYKLFLK